MWNRYMMMTAGMAGALAWVIGFGPTTGERPELLVRPASGARTAPVEARWDPPAAAERRPAGAGRQPVQRGRVRATARERRAESRQPRRRVTLPRPSRVTYEDPFALAGWLESRSDAELKRLLVSGRLGFYVGSVFRRLGSRDERYMRSVLHQLNRRLKRIKLARR